MTFGLAPLLNTHIIGHIREEFISMDTESGSFSFLEKRYLAGFREFQDGFVLFVRLFAGFFCRCYHRLLTVLSSTARLLYVVLPFSASFDIFLLFVRANCRTVSALFR